MDQQTQARIWRLVVPLVVCACGLIITMIICAIVVTRDIHAIRVQGQSDSADGKKAIADLKDQFSAILQRTDGLVEHADSILSQQADREAQQLEFVRDIQIRTKGLVGQLNVLADHGARAMTQFDEKSIPAVDAVVASVQKAVDANSADSQALLKAGTTQVEALGAPIRALGEELVVLKTATAGLGAVGTQFAAIVGDPGKPGTLGGVVTHADSATVHADAILADGQIVADEVAHPEKLPFWKNVALRLLGVVLPDLAHALLTRAVVPHEKIVNLPAGVP